VITEIILQKNLSHCQNLTIDRHTIDVGVRYHLSPVCSKVQNLIITWKKLVRRSLVS